ncbi:MAG: CYTH domain-containing protein [Bacteroidales bacterium]|nr:CYTH domain-containing protein [Bacteroidales bacterium]
MPLEIERKFLVVDDRFKSEAYEALPVRQGYLCSLASSKCSVRVRVRGSRGFLTIKSRGNAEGMTRYEFEKEIALEEAEELLLLAEPGMIDKTRYLVRATDGVHVWEVDEFHGDNSGLTVAEIELSSEDEPFSRPDWLGVEVTGDPRYYNSALKAVPFRNWKEKL